MVIDTIVQKMSEKKNQKSKIANMNFSASENSSSQILATNTVFHDGKTYFIHPIYTNYGSSTDGYIINRKRLIPRKGILHLTGYLQTTVRNQNGIKNFYVHRFVYECFNGPISDGMQINHKDSNKQNNCINNLELVTRQQNMIYKGKIRLGKQKSKKQNVPTKCEKFHYHHIFTNFGANKFGQIYNKKTKRVSIGIKKFDGYFNITLSQIGLQRKTIDVHRFVYECFNGPISDGMQINHKDSNKQNNYIKNLELMTRSENAKHAHEARKYKTKIEITTEKPIKSIKMDIELEKSDDEFTEDEKQLIDKKYNAIIEKIKMGKFPYKKQLQEHLPNMEFW